MGLIRKVRGWLYRHSRQAQADRIAMAIYSCTSALMSEINEAVYLKDPTTEHDAHVHMTRLCDGIADFSHATGDIIRRRRLGDNV